MKKLLLSFLLIMLAASGFAQWSINPKVNKSLVGSGNTMRGNSSVSDGAGGLIIVFEESVWDGINMLGYTQVFAQRLSAAGVAQWVAPVLVATCPDYVDKQVVTDGAGGVVLLWAQKATHGNNQPVKIYTQRLNPNGAKQWGANGKELTSTPGSYYISEMLFDNNSFVFSFTQNDDDDVYIQKLDINGNAQWGAGTKINDGVGEYDGKIFKDGAGYLVALAEEYDLSNGNGEGTRLYLQKVNANGSKNGSNILVDDLAPANDIEYYPEDVIYDGNGGVYYAISAADDNNDENVKLYLQHVTSNGIKQFTSTPWGLEVDANVGATMDAGGFNYWTYTASMLSDGAGGVVLGWVDTRNGNAGVYAQRYNSVGAKLWPSTDVQLLQGVVDYFDAKSIQFDVNGDLVYRLQRSYAYGKQHVYIQKTSLSGTLLYPAAGILVSSRDTQKNYSEMVVLNDKVVFIWEDYDLATYKTGIYFQSVFTNGALAADINFGGFTVINTRSSETFSSLQNAIDDTDTKDGDELRLAPGIHTGLTTITKQVGIYGNNVGVEPWNWSKPATIIKPAVTFGTTPVLFLMEAKNVVIDGLQFDGTNDALSDAAPITINSKAARTGNAIFGYKAGLNFDNVDITNNKFENFTFRAIGLFSDGQSNSVNIESNEIDNLVAQNTTSSTGNAYGIHLQNLLGTVSNNRLTRATHAIRSNNSLDFYSSSDKLLVLNNTASIYKSGIFVSGATNRTAPTIDVSNNNVSKANYNTWTADGLNTLNIRPLGLGFYTLGGSNPVTVDNNNVTGAWWGLEGYLVRKSDANLDRFKITGGSFNNNYIGIMSYNSSNTIYTTRMVVSGTTVNNSEAIGIVNDAQTGSFKSELALKDGVQVLHTAPTSVYANAISIYGIHAQLNELNDTKISGAHSNFISFASPSGNAPMTGLTVDGKDVTYDGTVNGQTFTNYKPSAAFNLALRNAVKARIYDGDNAANPTAGRVTIPSTLPVSLIDFNASLKSNGALITWSTASELNNKHFIIEKSIDGTAFQTLTTVDGKGTTHEKSSYQFTDVNFFQSAYYRLTQVDLNGTKTVYDDLVKHVKSLTDGDKVAIYPNPTVDKINIKLPASVASTTVKLIDINGKTLASKPASGGQVLTFATQHLPKGLYLVQYTDGGQQQSQKVVKQ